LLDLFTMTASLWTDPDLPLSYSFGYISATGLLSIVKPTSSISFGASILPAGKDTQGYNVTCQLQVFDYYLANASMNAMIKVTEVKMTTASLESMLFSTTPSTNQLTSTSTAAQQLNQAITEKMNKQICISAPDCAALNRQQCNTVKNTCGPCLAGKYVGEAGSHNTKCVAVNKRALAIEGDAAGSQCSNSSACGGWNECVNSVCVVPSKSCANDCNGNGVCVFNSTDTGASLSNCPVTSTECKAVCSCNQGFNGLFCDLTDADLLANQNLKHYLAVGIVNSTTGQDASLATVSNWISSVVSLTQNYADLSASSVSLLSDALASLLVDSVSLALPYDSVSDILTAVDNIVTSLSQNVAASDITRKMTTLLQGYSNFVLTQMVPMQYDQGSTYESFRAVNSVRPVANGTVVLSSTVTAAEQFTGLGPDTVTLKTGTGVTDVKIGMVVMRSSSLGSTLSKQLHSNPLMVTLPDLSVCSSSRCAFNVVLQSVDNTSYINGANSQRSFVTACGTDVVKTVYSCPNGLNVTAVCNGRPGAITSTCPYLVSTPSCARLSSFSALNDVCHSTSHSASQTTCQCSVPISAFMTSRSLNMLATPLFPGEVVSGVVTVGGTLQLATVTAFSTVTPPQPPTTNPSKSPISFTEAPYALPTIQIVTIVLVVVGACFAFGVALFFYLNQKRPVPWLAVVTTRKPAIPVCPMKVEVLEPAADNFNDSDWALPACKYRRKSEVETFPVNYQKPDLRLLGGHSNRAISPDFVPDFGILPDTENTEYGGLFLGPEDL
jgi:REJ domain